MGKYQPPHRNQRSGNMTMVLYLFCSHGLILVAESANGETTPPKKKSAKRDEESTKKEKKKKQKPTVAKPKCTPSNNL